MLLKRFSTQYPPDRRGAPERERPARRGRARRREGMLAVFTALGLGCLGCHGGKAPDAKAPSAPAVPVESALIEARPVPKSVTITGTLEPSQRSDLAANASGRVIRTFVERGDAVKAGALLAVLDSRGAEISRAEAIANAKAISDQLEAVLAECKRYEALRGNGAIAQQDYDRQMTQCRTQASVEAAARARASEAVRVVEDAAIRAPYAGFVAERFVNVGDYVQPSSKVVTLLVNNPLRLRLSVPEAVIPFTREGTVVRFKVLTLPDREFSATIKYEGREVRASSRDMITEAIVDNREQLLLPGLFVTVDVPTGTSNQPIVPKSALVDADSEPTVFAIVDDRLEQRAVRVGRSLAEGVAIAEGLKHGDRVVLNPASDLKDGSPVVVR